MDPLWKGLMYGCLIAVLNGCASESGDKATESVEPEPTAVSTTTSTQPRSAESLYQSCIPCHSADGRGGGGGPRISKNAVTVARVTEMWNNQVGGSPRLTSEEAQGLVNYVKGLSGVSTNPILEILPYPRY